MSGFRCVAARSALGCKPSLQKCQHTSGEELLLQQMRAGDARAFEEFVARYQPALQRWARSVVSDDTLSQDVVQETWLGVIRGLHKFEGRSSLKTWVFQILKNRAITLIQRERRTVSSTTDWPTEAGEDFGNDRRSAPGRVHGMMRLLSRSKRRDPEAILMAQERVCQVKSAVLSLSPRRRRVVELRIFRGYSAQSVSRILGITPGNQRVLLHRARLGLRDAIVEISRR